MAAPNEETPSCSSDVKHNAEMNATPKLVMEKFEQMNTRPHNDAPTIAKEPRLSANLHGTSSNSPSPVISNGQDDPSVPQAVGSFSCQNGPEIATGSKKRKPKPDGIGHISGSSSNVTVITIPDSSDKENVQNSSIDAASYAEKTNQSTATPVQDIVDTATNQQPPNVAGYVASIKKTQHVQKVSDAVRSDRRIPQINRDSAQNASPIDANPVQKASDTAAKSGLNPLNISMVVIPRRRAINAVEKQPEVGASTTPELPHTVTHQMATETTASSNQKPLPAANSNQPSIKATASSAQKSQEIMKKPSNVMQDSANKETTSPEPSSSNLTNGVNRSLSNTSILTRRNNKPRTKRRYTHRFCANCAGNVTGQWRLDVDGRLLCNACGQYKILNGVDRPARLFNKPERSSRRSKSLRQCAQLCH
uniref:GATA-type domain-containing protein n=1 Tax=Panagrellus redivivus TaxID=6233 RepID=A0A7E4VEL3_PANRE